MSARHFRRWYVVLRERTAGGTEVFRAYQLGPYVEQPRGKVVWQGSSLRAAVMEERRLNQHVPRIQSVPIEELLKDVRTFPQDKKMD